MRGLSEAKWGFVTRRLNEHVETREGATAGSSANAPKLGEFVVATVAALGEHEYLENPNGRRERMYPGDVIVGAWGNRYATDFYEGYLPGAGDEVHLLTSGGLIGSVASAHTSKGAPTVLEVIGPLVDADGRALSADDVAVSVSESARPELGTVVVLGSAMNAGKTTTTSAIVRGLTRAGLKVGAGKVTGSGSGNDMWSYLDAGAAEIADFVDFGMASTFGYPTDRLVSTMYGIRDHLVSKGAEAVVLEIADGILMEETRVLAAQLPVFADAVVLAVGDALGAMAGIKALAAQEVTVRAVSGLVTASPLATRELAAATGLTVLTPSDLVGGAALELLAERAADRIANLSPA